MKVKAVKSFAGTDGDGNPVSIGMGDVFELPEGVDWLQAGLVVPVVVRAEEKAEKAVVAPAESRRKATRRSGNKG